MKAYWLRIAVAACAIFLVGMVLVAVGRRGASEVRQAIENQSFSFGADNSPFRLDGRQLGTLSRVNVTQVSSQGFPRIELDVRLDRDLPAGEPANCDLIVANVDSRGRGDEELRCLDAAGVASGEFVEVGVVRLQPSGQNLRLFVPQSTLDDNNWSRWFRRTPAPRAAAANHASLQLQADSSKAFLMIRDEQGNPIFQLNADSEGAFIQVRDSNGQEIVRFRADSSGVVGNINTD